MNYVNYDNNIVQCHKCKIINWTGKFVNPSEIGSIEQLCTLRDAWASGSARWVRLSPAQVKAHVDEITEQHERGEIVVKTRKRRSDAGQSHSGKRKLPISDKENTCPAKKTKHGRTQLPSKSKEIIDSDSNEEDDKG